MPIRKGRTRIGLAVGIPLVAFALLSDRGESWVHASESQGRQQLPGAVSEPATATVTCAFRQGGDDVALAVGPGWSLVSARGWWDRGECPVVPAQVNVRLQANSGGGWRDIVWSGTATVPPGGHAEATFRCHSARPTSWRSIIEVDLFNRPDGSRELVTRPQPLDCSPDPP